MQLLVSSDQPEDFELPLYEKDSLPIKPQSQLQKALRRQRRKKHGGENRKDSARPDFVDMLSTKKLFDKDDPTAAKELSSLGKLSEGREQKASNVVRTALPPDVVSALRKMTMKMGSNPASMSRKVLSESEEKKDFVVEDDGLNDLINKDVL